MVRVPNKTFERNLARKYGRIVGVDEVGMACLAGPVVVCALAAPAEYYATRHRSMAWLRDSKTLQPNQRERFAELLMRESGLAWQIASCDPATIDKLNIYQASRLAMRNAVSALDYKGPPCNPVILVDGNKTIAGLDLPQQAIIGGDRKIWAIAAASILAKVHRDRLMTEYARQYPGYGFEIHKGYPTRLHRERLATLGPCPIHRRSFTLIRLPQKSTLAGKHLS